MAAVVWFRKGLRVHDNPALLAAAAAATPAKSALYPVFVLDPWFLVPERVSANRVQFLLQSLVCLDESLRALDSRLIVLRGKPSEVLPSFMAQHKVATLAFESDTEPYAVKRDAELAALAAQQGVTVSQHCSHTLYDPQQLLAANKGAVPKSYKAFCGVVAKAGKPAKPVPTPTALPPPAGLAAGLAGDTGGGGVPSLVSRKALSSLVLPLELCVRQCLSLSVLQG